MAVIVEGHHIGGQDIAEVFEDLTPVAQGLAEMVRTNPKWARSLKVKLYAKGDPSMIELDIAARDRVLIKTKINL